MPAKIRKRTSKNPWNTFLGDCSVVDEYLLDKPSTSLKWAPLHYLNVFLRAVGQPAFVNNPFCGAIIFASFFVQDYQVGLGCLLGGSVGVIGELVLRVQPWSLMRNGVAAFNAILTGTVISVLYPGFYGIDRDPIMWIFIAVGALASIYLCSAFGSFLGKVDLPYLALPFNMIIVCSFLTIQPDQNITKTDLIEVTDNSTNETAAAVEWCQVGRGILVSMSQVYGINHVSSSIMMNVAVGIASPLLLITSTIGATVGSFLGVAFLPIEDIQEVYDGVWGYNALLTMAAISCVFFAQNAHSLILGLLATAATSVVQFALRANMTLQNNIPVFTVPMTLVGLVFLLASNQSGSIYRVRDPSYPEKQAYLWFTKHRKIPQEEEEESGLEQDNEEINHR